MNAAWTDALALIRANREVLAVVAGVFILLPALAMAVLFADQQTQAMGMLRSMLQGGVLRPPVGQASPTPGWFVALSLAMFLVQLVGYLSLLALMDSRQRPTVGQAIVTGLKCLLPFVGAMLLFVIAYAVVAVVFSLLIAVVVGGLGAGTGTTGAAAGLIGIFTFALFVVVFWMMVRFSLTLAEIVLGHTLNPAAALIRSWRLTKGNSARLFGFYILLFLAYLVIAMVLFGVLMAAGAVLPGQVGGLVMGLVSGLISAVFAVLVTALIAAIYRQVAGPSAQDLAGTFE